LNCSSIHEEATIQIGKRIHLAAMRRDFPSENKAMSDVEERSEERWKKNVLEPLKVTYPLSQAASLSSTNISRLSVLCVATRIAHDCIFIPFSPMGAKSPAEASLSARVQCFLSWYLTT